MTRDPRYDILFEPVQIGPVTARNRFYQVPHCNGMGHQMPEAHAAMREIKAQGGWAVVSTEECEIHPSGDVSPYVEARLWDDGDIPSLALMCEKVKAHGALSAVELTHNGYTASNLYSREVALSPSHTPLKYGYPMQARAMTLRDISNYRQWHKAAAIRAKQAGFDIIYVYAAHDLSLAMHFLQRRRNQRNDEYGGTLENRIRLLREVLQDTKDAVGDRCAVAIRFATEEFLGESGVQNVEAKEIVHHLADLPDIWDVNVAAWYNDSVTSRFGAEGFQQPFTSWVKQITNKPVVGVGRFTSPDTMVRLIREGALDMIGAARPSIADPYLPKKIETGAINSIRECIGCNICVSGDMTITPIRCTQNPTMGEEWRKGWHPENIPAKKSEKRILVVGAGPAGLEATRALGQRGYEVMLAEASEHLGGRVLKESALPGLAEWRRVRDWRIGQIEPMPNVSVFRGNELTAEDVLAIGADAVVLATGSHWVKTGIGRSSSEPFAGYDSASVFTPDDIMAGHFPDAGPVLLYDDDNFYLASVLAEALVARGLELHFVTPDDVIAGWTTNTLEYRPIQKRLRKLGVHLHTGKTLQNFDGQHAQLACVWSDKTELLAVRAIVPVTMRMPNDELHQSLLALESQWLDAGIQSVQCIGDALAPGLIAHAVYAGHRFAREFEANLGENGDSAEVPFKRVRHLF
jgi:dimethylamine/trimethylamine dehydrogenase